VTATIFKVWIISEINSGNLCSAFTLEIINADVKIDYHKISDKPELLFILEQSDKNTYSRYCMKQVVRLQLTCWSLILG
jgi:hypothetical protein